jgi:anti-anti-sigma factor
MVMGLAGGLPPRNLRAEAGRSILSEPTHDSPERLSCEIHGDRSDTQLVLAGSLDLGTVEVLEARLDEVRRAGARHVTIDLGELAFLDSTGLRCLLSVDAESRRDGFALALLPGPPAVQRVFEITATTARLPFKQR